MERSLTPLSVWFWAAYLVASQTPEMSVVQFERQLGLSRYETAFGILHKLRAAMARPDQDRIGGRLEEHVEVDETWVGGKTRGEGRGVHHKTLVAAAVEVRHRKPGTAQDKRRDGRYAGRLRLAIAPVAALALWEVSSAAPLSLEPWSSPTTGPVIPGCGRLDTTTMQSLNAEPPRCRRSSCPSSISSKPPDT